MFMTIVYIMFSIMALILLFCVNVLACSFALGRMHIWLKGKAEVFGDDEGLRDELANIRGHVIECRNNTVRDEDGKRIVASRFRTQE